MDPMGYGEFIYQSRYEKTAARYSRWSLKRHHSSTLKQIGLGTRTQLIAGGRTGP